MSNMSYCRFRNTLQDLQDCYDNITDNIFGVEFRSREHIIALAKKIARFDAGDFIEACENCERCKEFCDCDEEEDN